MATGYLKTFDQALLEMAQRLLADLGVSVDLVRGSSVERSILEAVAFQVADLSERAELSIHEAIPEAIYRAFNFGRLGAQVSRGALSFGLQVPSSYDIFIPAGTEAATGDEQFFASTQDVTLSAGQQLVHAPAQSLSGGQAANIPAYSITRLVTGVPGLSLVTNQAPFSGGADEETPEDQLERFLEHIAALDRSNLMALAIVARTATDGALTARNILIRDGKTDPAIAPGRFQVHCYRLGGVPDSLYSAIQAQVDKYRSGGCIPTFFKTAGTPVAVRAHLTTLNLGLVSAAQRALGEYFDGLKYGQKASRENIIAALKHAHPAILEADVELPSADVPCGPYDRLELGTVTLTEALGQA